MLRRALVAWSLVVATGLALAAPTPAAAQSTLGLSGPDRVEVGSTIEVVVTSPADAVAVEAAVAFDRTAIDFGGVYFADDSTRILTATNQAGWVDVGGYRCDLAGCDIAPSGPVGTMTLRFAVDQPGAHTISLARGLAVAADGAVVADGAGATITVVATAAARPAPAAPGGDDDGELEPPAETAPGFAGDPGATPGPLAGGRSDVARTAADATRDGRVDHTDVLDVGLGWAEARRQGDPCVASGERLERLDADGSGCIDVADIVAVAGLATAARPERLDNGRAAAADAADRPPMVVNSTSDEWDRQLSNEICDTASGVCSLRAALHQANWNPGPDTIHFAIPGNGPHRINLGEQLYITDTSGGVTIDGFTQPGARANTDPYLSNASIRIEIRGQGYGAGTNAIVITSGDNTIRGLAVYNAFSNIRLTGDAVTGNRIVGNHIGTNANATYEYRVADVRDQSGVEIVDGASFNRIGTPDLADRNVISGNPYSGVRINHADTTGNYVQNNLIGLTPSGNDSLYTYVAGVDVQWGAKETIVGGYQEHAGNVVTGNSNYGIDLSHSSKNNIVVGNRLGTDATGTRVLSHSPNLIGLAIKDDSTGNTIEYNVSGGNRWHGVWHRHNLTGPNTFRSNWLGIGLDGSDIGNDRDGVYLSGHDDTYERNVIAYNDDEGISIQDYLGGNYHAGPPQYTERNRLTRNAIFDNGSLGVDILSGHNGIPRPSITSASTGSARGNACGGCTVELFLADGEEGRRFLAATTAAGNGSWSIGNGAIRDSDLVVLATRTNGESSEFSTRVRVG
ncbi:MAG: right-handed parallel beta-helix repeat-containing protein, partial [Actinomycetota bacterium]